MQPVDGFSSSSEPGVERPWRVDPLWILLALGVLLYAVERWATDQPLVPHITDPERVIIVSDDVVAERRRALERRYGRAVSEDELHAEMRAWLDDEILSREARQLGLDQEDAVIRARLARRMAEVLEQREAPPLADDEVLRAWHDTQPERWVQLDLLTLRQLFVEGSEPTARDSATHLLLQLQAGADPSQLAEESDDPPGGPVLRGRTPERLGALFGQTFVEGVLGLEGDAWGVVASERGWHVIQVVERQRGGPLPWTQVRERVRVAWEADQVQRAAREAVDQLRAGWVVVGWPP